MRKTIRLKKIIVLPIFFLLVSCYSVKIVSTNGTPNPDPLNDNDDDYRNKRVIVVDTVIKAGTTTASLGLRTQRTGCESGKIHSVEYKNTFGGTLLYLVTFGSKRKVKIKYVCMKTEN